MISADSFASNEAKASFDQFMAQWSRDPNRVKVALQKIMEALRAHKATVFDFHPRPGISYSIRASVRGATPKHRPYYALIDIVEEAQGDGWLSVCFYADTISDPDDKGNLIPRGLLDEDGYCFDVDSYDEVLLAYIETRIDEAYESQIA